MAETELFFDNEGYGEGGQRSGRAPTPIMGNEFAISIAMPTSCMEWQRDTVALDLKARIETGYGRSI
jgi:hypothetical protein